ncbi:hypothetical protein ACIBCH_20890 [Amycolatopsis thailandensis]|uniref:hypothetical protein n=1 Tax=Amycolatopsis thailandensis TaxID=589330 RepID=UPI00379CC9F7
MIEEKSKAEDAVGRHAAIDGPTLPDGIVVVQTAGGRRYRVDPDNRQTQTFLAGFPESAVEHTADLEALAVAGSAPSFRRVVGAFVAFVWFRVVEFFGRLVDEVATTVRLSARWELDHSRTIARLVVAALSVLVLAGTGVGAWFL